MYIWLVCCGSIPRLIISFALNVSYCRSRFKNELYKYIWLVGYIHTYIHTTLFVLAGYKKRQHMLMWTCWLLQYPSIDNFFRSKRVILSLTLKERGIHVYLARLLLQYSSIDNFFCSKRVILSLTLKERGIQVYLACLLWQYPSIDNFFRSKRVILSLTLKERGIQVYLACLLWQYPSIDNFFRSKRVVLSLTLKNEVYMYIWLVCCGSIRHKFYCSCHPTWPPGS